MYNPIKSLERERLSTTFILIIIIMHIYNWYHSITASIPLYTRDEISCMYTISPLLPLLPLFPLFPCSTYLEPSLL
jgi:hypothetical protein